MGALDKLRGKYIASPYWMKRTVSPVLSMVPVSLLYGMSYRNMMEQIEISRTDPEHVLQYQRRSLVKLIESCMDLNDYYRRIFRGVFETGGSWRSSCIEDLQKLPILDREDIRAHIGRFLVRPAAELDEVSTSGSSGHPLTFFLDRDRGARELAYIHRIWAQIGFRPGKHRRATIRGFVFPDVDKKPWEFDPPLKELRFAASQLAPETMRKYLDLMEKYEVNFLHGYPSAMALLAGFAKTVNWRKPGSLIGILPISEALFDHQRSLIREGFGGLPILSYYGQSEKVAFAGELPEAQDVFEFEPLYGITELVAGDGQPVREKGERGRIVSTGLLNRGMPFFRYDTGDTAELVGAAGRDNCYRMRVRAIRSRRAHEYIVDFHGGKIYFTAIIPHSKVFARVQEFQLYQENPGEVVVKILPRGGHDDGIPQAFVDEIQTKVGSRVRFQLQLVDRLPPNPRDKRHFIDQKLGGEGVGSAQVKLSK